LGTAWAEPGFSAAASARAPLAVQQAAFRTLQIWTPAYYTVRTSANYASIRLNLERMKAPDFRASMRFKINREELEYCEAHKLAKCFFTERVAQGSAFVLEDGTLIATRHDFTEGEIGLRQKFKLQAADWQERLNNSSTRSQAETEIAAFKADPLSHTLFLLTDVEGHIVFNSGKQGYRFLRFGNLVYFRGEFDSQTPKLRMIGQNAALEEAAFSGADWVNQDIVRIQLSVRLPALQIGTCMPGSTNFIAGFAGRTTTTRAVIGARDAIRDELSLSRGVTLSVNDLKPRSLHWRQFYDYSRELAAGAPALLSDADGTGGMSGGPILNEQGRVCGMFKAFFPGDADIDYNPQAKVYELFSFGVPLENLSGI
jgi:hypothetical protein